MKKITFLIIITTSILSCNSSTKEQPSRNTNLTTVQIDSIAKVKNLNSLLRFLIQSLNANGPTFKGENWVV